MSHSFLFHPEPSEFHDYLSAIEKVESQDKFRNRVGVDLQLAGGRWIGEFVTGTSRLLMDFITEVTMELPTPEAEQWTTSDQESAADELTEMDQELVSDGPTEETEEEDEPEEYDLSEMSEEEAAKSFAEHEKAADRPVPPKKLKKPASVGKTSNSAITVEED